MNRLTEYFFREDRSIFTQADATVVVDGTDFSRHGLTKRAIAKGEIVNVRRGLYCLAEPYRKRPVNVFSLSQYVYGPSYVSLESALAFHGWIPEAVYSCTCACYRDAKDFNTPLGVFSYERVPQRAFYCGVERRIDAHGNVFFMALPAKALADYVYARRLTWDHIDSAIGSLRIEPELCGDVKPRELADLMENYRNRRVRRFLSSWRKTLLEGPSK